LVAESGGNLFPAVKELHDSIESGKLDPRFLPLLELFGALKEMPKRLIYRLISKFRGMIEGHSE